MSGRCAPPQAVEIPHVMGFLPGYDDDLADQLVIILAHYDGLGQEPDGTVVPAANDSSASVGIMIEMARLWEEQNLGPRRSVLFIAWGGGQLDDSGAAAFLADDDHFRKLAARVNTPPLRPALLIQLGPLGKGGAAVAASAASDAALLSLWQDAAAVTDLPVVVEPRSHAGWTAIPALALYGQEDSEQLNVTAVSEIGQTLTLSLIKILRQVNY